MDPGEIRTRIKEAKASIEKLEHETVLESIRQAGVEDARRELSAQVDEIDNLVDAFEHRVVRLEHELEDSEKRYKEAEAEIATLKASAAATAPPGGPPVPTGSAAAGGSPATTGAAVVSGSDISEEMQKVYEYARTVRPRVLEDPEGKRQDPPTKRPTKARVGRRTIVGGAFKFEPRESIAFDTGDTIAVYGRSLDRVGRVELDRTHVPEATLQRTPNAILFAMPALKTGTVKLLLHTPDGVLAFDLSKA